MIFFGMLASDRSCHMAKQGCKYHHCLSLHRKRKLNVVTRNTVKSIRHFLYHQGNSHAVYNGTLLYQEEGTSNLVRYELATGTATKLHLPQLSYRYV